MKRWTVLLASLLLVLVGCTIKVDQSSSDSEKILVVAGNGGKIERVIREKIGPRFEKEHGAKIKYIPALSGEILSKVQLQKNSPQIDIAIFVPLDVRRATDKDLIQPLDTGEVPNLKDVDEKFISVKGMSVPSFGLTIAPAYNTEVFKKEGIPPIRSWNDLINSKLKGRIAVADIANDWGFAVLYNLANANGGSIENLEPGLKKAKELAAYASTFYKNSTQMMPAMQQGDAVVGVMGSYATAELVKQSEVPLKIVIPKEGAPIQSFHATLVKNAPHEELAKEFLNELASKTSQSEMAEDGFYPTRADVEIPSQYKDVLTLGPEDKVFRPDIDQMAKIREGWIDRWNKEVSTELGKKVR